MERQLISSGAAFEERVGYSRAVRVGRPGLGLGHGADHAGRRRPADNALRAGADLPRRSSSARSARQARRMDDVVRTRIYVTDAGVHRRCRARARRGIRTGATGDDRHRHAAARSALAGGDRGGSGDTPLVKQIFPPSITGKGSLGTSADTASVLDHSFGKGDPYTLGVEEEYMLLDPETWDLVQHIDSVLAAVEAGEHQGRLHAELMQSVLEVTTPGVPDRGGRDAVAVAAARLRGGHRPRAGLPLRLRRHAPLLASSSGSASRRATATATSSTSSSTSRGASSSSACTCTLRSTIRRRRSR